MLGIFFMRAIITPLGSLLLICCAGCQNGQASPPAKPAVTWTQWCECGVQHTYGYTFDDRDYAVIADLANDLHVPARTYWEGPEGPEPAATSTFAKNLSFGYLHQEMPALGKDTFQSFLKRNDPIPAHFISSWHSSPRGKVVTIVKREAEARKQHTFHLSRAGFGKRDDQSLIYDDGGEIFLLSRGKKGDWQLVGQTALWIE